MPDWNTAKEISNTSAGKIVSVELIDNNTYDSKKGFIDLLFYKDIDDKVLLKIREAILDGDFRQKITKDNEGRKLKELVQDNEFSGALFQYDSAGAFIDGRIYNNGKQVYDIIIDKSGISKPYTTEMNCNNPKGPEIVVCMNRHQLIPVTVTTTIPKPPTPWPLPPSPFPFSPIGPIRPIKIGEGNGASNFITASPKKPIKDIVKELECFNKLAAASLTIYVDQPSPGKREAYNGFNVGHAFISISQQNGNGQTIVRTLGFYPEGNGNPLTPTKPSVFGNDGGHGYDVSITVPLTPGQFNGIYGFILDYKVLNNGNYNLNNYNCTNFASSIAYLAGLVILNTKSSWPGGGGMNPGNFGEDLIDGYGNDAKNQAKRSSDGSEAPNDSGSCGN